jgi:hypothetical protein
MMMSDILVVLYIILVVVIMIALHIIASSIKDKVIELEDYMQQVGVQLNERLLRIEQQHSTGVVEGGTLPERKTYHVKHPVLLSDKERAKKQWDSIEERHKAEEEKLFDQYNRGGEGVWQDHQGLQRQNEHVRMMENVMDAPATVGDLNDTANRIIAAINPQEEHLGMHVSDVVVERANGKDDDLMPKSHNCRGGWVAHKGVWVPCPICGIPQEVDLAESKPIIEGTKEWADNADRSITAEVAPIKGAYREIGFAMNELNMNMTEDEYNKVRQYLCNASAELENTGVLLDGKWETVADSMYENIICQFCGKGYHIESKTYLIKHYGKFICVTCANEKGLFSHHYEKEVPKEVSDSGRNQEP